MVIKLIIPSPRELSNYVIYHFIDCLADSIISDVKGSNKALTGGWEEMGEENSMRFVKPEEL